MDATRLPRATLLGNFLGCQIIADFAMRYPGRVTCLVMVGPTTDPSARTARPQIFRAALTAPAERPSLIPLVAAEYAMVGPRRLLQELRRMLDDRIEEKLPQITAPCLVVRGARDAIVPQCWAEEVARLVRTHRVVVVPGWGHGLNYSAPLELAGIVRSFLRERRLS